MQPDLTTQTGFDFTLPLRDSTVGLWRFRDNLSDETDNGNDLASATLAGKFEVGHTENGLTAAAFDGSDLAALAAASAGDFDMASDSFSVEVIARTSSSDAMFLVGKNDGGTPLLGFYLGLGTGIIVTKIGDGVNEAQGNSTATVHDGRWHHIAVVVDRTNDLMHFYIDGVEDSGSPSNISSVTGSVSAPSYDLKIGNLFDGGIDEVCVSKEVLTAAAVEERATGQPLMEHEFEEDFMLKFLPRIHHGKDDLKQFLKPFDAAYAALRRTAETLPSLVTFDRCPPEHLSHLAANFGFELIDEPFCTTAERREFLRWVIWLYRRKGTLATVEKIIELLGFEVTLTEEFPDKTPFVLNFHRLYDRDQISEVSFEDGFTGNLAAWTRLGVDSHWRMSGGELIGTGDGTDGIQNGMVFDDSLEDYYIETDYELASTLQEFGIVLAYVDEDNWVRLGIERTATDDIVVRRMVDGVPGSESLKRIDNAVVTDYVNGQHKLWAYVNHATGKFTIGFDDETVLYDEQFDISGVPTGKKGLWANRDMTVKFDNVRVLQLFRQLAPVLHTGELPKRVLWIEVLNSPPYATERRQYLERVLPRYLPFGVVLGWVRRIASASRIGFRTGSFTVVSGWVLSTNRAARIGFRTAGVTAIWGDIVRTPAATRFGLRTSFRGITKDPGAVRFGMRTGSISKTTGVELIAADYKRDDTSPTEDYALIFAEDYPLAENLIDGDQTNFGTQAGNPGEQDAAAVECSVASKVKYIHLYDDVVGFHHDGLWDGGTNDKLEVYYSTGGNWILLEQFDNLTRVNKKNELTITSPVSAKYWKIRAYDVGCLLYPDENRYKWAEIELMEIKEVT